MTVTPVGIPLPRRSKLENPVANDTTSNVPVEPAKEKPVKKERAVRDDDDGIAIKNKKQKKRPKDRVKDRTIDRAAERASETTHRYVPKQEYKPNQVYSSTAPAVSSNLYSGTPGTAIGIGNNNAFGNRFGAYADLMRRRISEKWRTNEIDPRLTTAPPAVVTFELFRDGTIRNVQLKEKSGVTSLDYSVQRAVTEAAPFPPIPREYERDSAVIELSFHLKR